VARKIDHIEKRERGTTCPITGLPVIRLPEWTDVPLDENYWTSVEVVGGHILKSMPRGYATASGVATANALHHQVIETAIGKGVAHVHVADYSNFNGSTLNSRRDFAEDLKRREGLQALIVHDTPPLFRLSIGLGRRILGLRIPIEIAANYRDAVRRALEILKGAGIDEVPLPKTTLSAQSPRSHSGSFADDAMELQFEVVEGHIVHASPTGYLRIAEMEKAIEFENLAVASTDRSKGPLVYVADFGGIRGVTAAARRLYVATLRNRQAKHPISLYVCYGVPLALRHAINISRPFLPYRVRIARDRETALEMARRERESGGKGALDRLRRVFGSDPDQQSEQAPPDIEEILRLIANIDWESDDVQVSAETDRDPTDPLAPVANALELIKADVNELFRARRRTEQALRESEERYRTILESIVDGYYEIDARGQVIFCNDALLSMFGYDRSEIENLDALSLLAPETKDHAVIVFTRVYETGDPAHSISWELSKRDGSSIQVEISISLITDADDQPVGFRGIVRDVTERERTAREKADLEVQLQRSQRMEAIGTLAGGIAHNFNNLLMGIQGNVSLLARELDTGSPLTARLQTVEALVEGGSKLTAQLLGYARSGRVDVRVIDLNTLVRETAETFSLTRREYRVHTDLAERELPIEVDPAQIEQALLNLLINAADSMPRGGDVFVSSRVAERHELGTSDDAADGGPYAVVSVRDTGCGMDEDTLEHIFEPFFTTKGISGGTGLGLASTYGIVRAHGGQIDVESAVGEGSVFSFAFPTSARSPAAGRAHRDLPIEGEGTIMVIEDDDAVLDACSSMLSLLQYTPICVASGRAAIDIYADRKDEIDLVILDLILADLSGAEVFEAIRAVNPEARVLLSSGYSLDGEAAGLLKRGCDDFIQKPFTIEQLSTKIEKLLKRP
jgi:PAS domain S-box-containing protein